jgi:mono/diheme cytochrome c family protein
MSPGSSGLPLLGGIALACALSAAIAALTAHPARADAGAEAGRNARQEAPRSTRLGAYTASQAVRGEQVYEARCGLCHQPQQYVGDAFMKGWAGQTADTLFDLLRTTMPKDNPGSLKPQEYADVMAYIFRLNGLPPGDLEMKGTARALKAVVIEAAGKP